MATLKEYGIGSSLDDDFTHLGTGAGGYRTFLDGLGDSLVALDEDHSLTMRAEEHPAALYPAAVAFGGAGGLGHITTDATHRIRIFCEKEHGGVSHAASGNNNSRIDAGACNTSSAGLLTMATRFIEVYGLEIFNACGPSNTSTRGIALNVVAGAPGSGGNVILQRLLIHGIGTNPNQDAYGISQVTGASSAVTYHILDSVVYGCSGDGIMLGTATNAASEITRCIACFNCYTSPTNRVNIRASATRPVTDCIALACQADIPLDYAAGYTSGGGNRSSDETGDANFRNVNGWNLFERFTDPTTGVEPILLPKHNNVGSGVFSRRHVGRRKHRSLTFG